MGAARHAAAVLAVLAVAGCGTGPGGHEQDADTEDADVDGLDGEADAEADADVEPVEESAMSFLVAAFDVAVDRVCDLDGDGSPDNALADIGEPAASLAAMMLNGIGDDRSVTTRALLHVSRVDDPSVPSADETEVLFLSGAVPAEVGEDGMGAFWLSDVQLDGCGEPEHALSGSLEDGRLVATGDVVRTPLGGHAVDFASPWLVGSVAPHGAEAQLHFCGVATARDLGAIDLVGTLASHTLLELLVAGGLVVGLPSVSGGTPDVDLDGDGLERFVVDVDGHIESCVDGDLSVIGGRDCWQDERMADGFSLTAALDARPSRFLGPHPASSWLVDGACEGSPPEEGLFGACGGDLCARWEGRPCDGACGGEMSELCAWDCAGYGPCLPEATGRSALETCDDLVVEGGASCLGSPPSVPLVDGSTQARGAWLADPVTVGMGPVAIEARALAAQGSSDEPGGGWGVVAYLGTEGDWLGEPWLHYGFNFAQRGYTAEWLYDTNEDDPTDRVVLRAATGTGEYSLESIIAQTAGAVAQPAVDAGVGDPVAQRLRLLVHPDLPETEENELAVEAQFRGDDGAWSRGLSCHGSGCPVEVRPGDVLRVGVFAGVFDNDARIELAGPAPLVARAANACP